MLSIKTPHNIHRNSFRYVRITSASLNLWIDRQNKLTNHGLLP